jgi:FMN phosphatase YigB (HAD superfamily)
MKVVLVDLDHTLLNTTDFKEALAATLGLSPKQWEEIYEQYVMDYGWFNPEDFLKGVEPEKKIRFYGILEQLPRFLYSDSKLFLQQCLQQGWKIVIFTFGEPRWQKLKFEYLKFPDSIEAEFITTPKVEALAQYIAHDIVMIDDKAEELDAVKQAYPKVQTIWIHRPNGKYRNIEPKLADKIIEDLTIDL